VKRTTPPLPVETLEWSDVRVFLDVATTGSYARTARRLGVSVMTVGRRVQALEEALGVRLVERLPDGHRLTAEGHALVSPATRMAAAADDLTRAARLRHGPRIRICAPEWESLFVVRHLGALRAAIPGLDVEVAMTHVTLSLARRETDVILAEDLPAKGDAVSRKLGPMAFAPYGSAEYVDRHRQAHDEQRYHACDWVGFDADHQYMPVARWLTEKRRAPATYRFTNAVAILEGARAGVGLALLPCWIAETDGNLVRVGTVLDELTRPTYALFATDRRRDATVRAVLDGLTQMYRSQADALAGI